MATNRRLLPTGECWWGCGAEASIGSFFLPGHDKTAKSAVISVEYGGVPQVPSAARLRTGRQESLARGGQLAFKRQTPRSTAMTSERRRGRPSQGEHHPMTAWSLKAASATCGEGPMPVEAQSARPNKH